jgi:hypothetical protein
VETLRWFEPIAPTPWLQGLTACALLVLAAAGVVAHAPTVLPGPLAPSERAHRRLPTAARWWGNAWPVLAAAAALAATLLLLAPPREPVELVLHSRLRLPGDLAPGLGAGPEGRTRLDLGPAVDALLEECRRQGGRDWVTGSPAERAAARAAVLADPTRADLARLTPGGEPSVSDCRDLPPWLIQSVEISVVRMALRRENAVSARVAPGPTRSRSQGWPFAAGVLTAQGRPVICVDEVASPADGLVVQRLSGARLHPATKRLTAWAVIQGRFSALDAPAAAVRFRLVRTSPPTGVDASTDLTPHRLEPDASSSRVVALRFDLKAAPGLGSALVLSDETGRCSTPVRVVEENEPQPVLAVAGAQAEPWRNALDLARNNQELKDLRNELASLDAPPPRLVGRSGAPVLLTDAEAAVLAPSQETCEWALRRLRENGDGRAAGAVPDGRVSASRLEPATVFSWLELPVAAPAATDLAMPAEPSVWSLRREPPIGRKPGPKPPPAPLELVGRRGAERFVVLLGPPPDPEEPLRRIAQVRSVCLAVRYIAEDGEADVAADGDAAGEAAPAPLVTERDLQKAAAERVAWADRAAVAAVGICLALTLWRVVRCLPRA